MVPNKFEKQLRVKMQKRKIQPSKEAWNRISGQLELMDRPKSKKWYGYGIAASFIGFLFIAFWYFNTQEPPIHSQTVVKEVPVHSTEKKPGPKSTLGQKLEGDKIVGDDEKSLKGGATDTVPKQFDEEVKNTVAIVERKDMPEEKVSIALKPSEKLIDSKVAEIVAQVDLLEKEKTVVTDAEIDALLLQAQQEIIENPLFRKDHSVDASALLADVEDELDKSFRDQIFDALKDGFIKVRTAVADRNK